MPWHVIRTRGPVFAKFHEFEVRDVLIAADVHALVPVEFRLGRAKQPVRRPRIPGYVFASWETWTDVPWATLHRMPEVIGVMQQGGRLLTLSQSEVDTLAALSVPLQQRIQGARYAIGDRIKIKRGALAELPGIVSRIEGAAMWTIIEMMGKTHEVRVSEADVAA